jgi:hypothetical protein
VADPLVGHGLVVQTRGGPALNKGIDAPRKAGAFGRTTLFPTGNADRLMDPILPRARLEFAKGVILDTSTYSRHPQRDGRHCNLAASLDG